MAIHLSVKMRLNIVVAAVTLTCAGVYFFLFRSQLKKISELRKQHEILSTNFAKIKKDQDYLPTLEEEFDRAKTRIETIHRRIPPEESIPEFIELLSMHAAKIGVKDFSSLTPAVPQRVEKYTLIPIMVNFRSKYMRFIEFLKLLEATERLTRVDKFNLRANTSNPVEIDVELSLSIFSMEDFKAK